MKGSQPLLAIGLLIICSAAMAAQQRDAAPGQPPPAGTAVISGVIRSAEPTPTPVPRAIVTVTFGRVVRTTLSDDDGRFSIGGLPAGTFTVAARKAAWLPAQHGATRPGSHGVPVVVAAGARVEAPLTMFKGAAVTGVLRDILGEPVSGVPVSAIDVRTGVPPPVTLPLEFSSTDDRGVYRLYGLPPGEYLIAAVPPASRAALVGALSTGELDAVASIASQVHAANAAPAGSGANLPSSQAVHYSPAYYPGTPYIEQALRLKLQPGEERRDINLEIAPVLVGSLEGTVSVDPNDRALLRVDLMPWQRLMSSATSPVRAQLPDQSGKFSFNNLPPGRYRVIARLNPGGRDRMEVVDVPMPGGGTRKVVQESSSAFPTGDFHYAYADVDVRGDDRTSVTLTMQPGGVISGRLRIDTESGAKPPDLTRVGLSLEADVSATAPVPSGNLLTQTVAEVRLDGTFELRGIGPGRFRLKVTGPLEGNVRWQATSALAGSRDLFDEWMDFGPGMSLPDVVVALSDRRSGVDGLLQSATGQPSSSVNVIVVPLSRDLWKAGSRRIASVRPQSDGRFTFDVPPGDYALAAVTDFDPLDLTDPAWLEQIVGAGVKVTVAEGARTRQDIRIK
jgi:uncharacterized protein (DUF2141 family)